MTGKYKIVLEKGEAAKSIFEMSREEILQAGERIFKKVSLDAQRLGLEPAVSVGVKKRSGHSNPK